MRAYVVAVCLGGLGTAVAVLAGPPLSGGRGPEFAVLAALVVLGELRPIVVTRGGTRHEVTLSSVFALALALIGPLSLAVAVHTCAVALRVLVARRPPAHVLFELATSVLTVAGARVVFALLTGSALLSGQPLVLPQQLPAALAAGAAYFALSTALGSVARALTVQAPVAPAVARDLQAQLATSAVLLSFAPVVAAAVGVTVWLVPLLLAPIAAISKSARLLAAREHEALHDSLTGLPNRTLFRLRLQQALEAARVAPARLAVLLVDLDHFKEINDTLGHQVGDELIAEVSRRLSANLRPGDTVARLGGDEFAVLATLLHGEGDAVALAERLLEVLEDPFVAGEVRLDVQASLGIAVHPAHGADVDLLLRRADIALYQAKRERGMVRVYEAGSDDHTPEKLALAAELRAALQNDELFLEFQPQIAPVSGRTVGFEALVRWDHPTRGLLLPDDFVPVVENTGLIQPLTMAVLDRALSALADWRAAGHEVSVAVNLSVRHLTDLGLPRRVEALLKGRGIPPSALVLEVTETVIMSDPTRAVAVLSLLRDLGIGVAVDDFGTGYSSLAYLRRLQVDELKIDKSFVMDLPRDEGDAVIVRSTIELGHNLGLRVVAEGVEDEATL
ncbi:MAG TPA: EAL domain-containing protein, partial [Mycobacteriales bacterium]|nr:EAL domain-containing protein [Mycobacteriales bacterium]